MRCCTTDDSKKKLIHCAIQYCIWKKIKKWIRFIYWWEHSRWTIVYLFSDCFFGQSFYSVFLYNMIDFEELPQQEQKYIEDAYREHLKDMWYASTEWVSDWREEFLYEYIKSE